MCIRLYKSINLRKDKLINSLHITISKFLLQLHIAAANGYLRVVEFLLDQHVSTDVEDNDKWQPVHAAACWGLVSSNLFIYVTIQIMRLL